MGKRDREKLMLAHHILEVRHAASGSFLDVRGFVADFIRGEGFFPHWRIDNNVVNFRDMPDRIERDGAFVGYKSAGYIVQNPETRNYFVEKASAFWRALLKNKHYKLPEGIRFGCRTMIFVPSTVSFDEVNKSIFQGFFTQKVIELIGGQETDVQLIIELTESRFNVRLSGGPVQKDEVNKYFNFESDHFKKAGLFLDLDYSKEKDLSLESVPSLLHEAIELTWNKAENIASELGL